MTIKLHYYLLFLSLGYCLNIHSQSIHPYDPNIQTIVNSVNGDTLWNDIAKLQSMERYAKNSKAIVSSNYLKTYFKRLGYDTVYFHNFNASYTPNVIAVKYGKTIPDSAVIVGAHYDVYANGAPGADDNGSGTAATMETGRVLAAYDFIRTVKLICFSGEEEWDVGSAAYASAAKKAGEKIIGVLGMDATAYLYPGDPINCDVYCNDSKSYPFKATFVAYTNIYMPGFGVADVEWPVGASSDVESFWNNGYPAIMPSEGSFDIFTGGHMSPYMHTSGDVLGQSANSKEQEMKITQSVVATAAGIAELYSSATEINDNIAGKNINLNIFPNPASSNVTVNYIISGNIESNIILTEISGRVIKNIKHTTINKGKQSLDLSLDGIPGGLYLLKLSIQNHTYTQKLSIIK